MATNRRRQLADETDETSTNTNPKSNALKIKLDHLNTFEPLTDKQKEFFDNYKRGDYFNILLGSAGTGKSFIALYKALEEVLARDNPFKKVVIVRSNVTSRDVGHLPGSLDEKMEQYEQPYIQICNDLFNRKDAYQRLKEQDYIEFVSTSFIRGTTFNNAVILVDEIQNMGWQELYTVTTRCGYNSKLIFCGDYKQNDLNKKTTDVSGLVKFHEVARMMGCTSFVEFSTADIVRSDLTKDFIIAAEKYEDDINGKI